MTTDPVAEIHDVVIVGSGPAGYTAAIYAARASMKPIVLAGSVTAGGELMNTTEVENFPGFPDGILGPDLMTNLAQQARRFGADIRMADATTLDLTGEVKRISLGSGEEVFSRAVILATGSAYRALDVPGERPFSGRGVSWCATCDGFFFRDRRVAVIGGGDSAVEEALFLTKFASRVFIIHRRGRLRASKIMADRATANPKITFIWNAEVTEIVGEDNVTGVLLRDLHTQEQSSIDVSGVFVAIGHEPRVSLFTDQLALTDAGTVRVDGRTSVTSLPGVFAAGDVVDPVYRQAVVAAGSGCTAAIDAEHWLANSAVPKHELALLPAS